MGDKKGYFWKILKILTKKGDKNGTFVKSAATFCLNRLVTLPSTKHSYQQLSTLTVSVKDCDLWIVLQVWSFLTFFESSFEQTFSTVKWLKSLLISHRLGKISISQWQAHLVVMEALLNTWLIKQSSNYRT